MKRFITLLCVFLALCAVAYANTSTKDLYKTGALTNVTAGYNYYPSTSGIDLQYADSLAVLFLTSGGATATVEALPYSSSTWIDITKSGTDTKNWTSGNANYTDISTMVHWDNFYGYQKVRVKLLSDGSNAVDLIIYGGFRLN